MLMDGLRKFPTRPTGAGETFQLFRDGTPRTRAWLMAETGHSRSTVAARIDALVRIGVLAPTGEASSTGGRPPATFAFEPSARVVLGVDLGATRARVGLTDLAGKLLAELDELVAITDGPRAVLEWVADTAEKLLAQVGRTIRDLAGVGIGVPGPVDHTTGRPVNPPIMPGWNDVDVPQMLSARLGVPVAVDNDANIIALGEQRTIYPGERELLFVKVATGIGAGILMDGELRRGAQGAAGDIGHLSLAGHQDVLCRCGNYGCLEAVASLSSIAAHLSAETGEPVTTDDVVARVRVGDVRANSHVRQAGRDIGMALASAVNLLNPSRIVVGGHLALAGDQLIAGIREIVYQRCMPLATARLQITTARAGNNAGIVGAATLVIDHFLAPEAVEGLILSKEA
ncbi:Transcriptional regulator/sugar kinase [Serinibacter arcticus]|uniref:Transcriptional regulator/sugar kinase n=2 Tax=Serinibacter arcticus TaxID=1655435 RepID=A0A4Z1E1B4_9MICO|nr:Transcriptional regulator/sugar kinase [Serinibacter arcticus]